VKRTFCINANYARKKHFHRKSLTLSRKSFASKATYKQHLESNKHRENLKKFNKGGAVGADGAAPEFKEQQEGTQKTALEDQTVCLFCNKKNPDLNE